MSESVDTETKSDGSDDVVETSPVDNELKRAIKRRDAALAERRKAESQLSELKASIAEREEAEQRRQEELEKSAGEHAKIAERKEKQLAKAQERIAELEAAETKRIKAKRMDAFVDSISSASGVKNRSRLRGLLREANELYDVDTSPEEVTDDLVTEVIEAMKRLDEETFAPKPSKPTPTPGAGVSAPTDGKINWREVAAAGGVEKYNEKIRNG